MRCPNELSIVTGNYEDSSTKGQQRIKKQTDQKVNRSGIAASQYHSTNSADTHLALRDGCSQCLQHRGKRSVGEVVRETVGAIMSGIGSFGNGSMVVGVLEG